MPKRNFNGQSPQPLARAHEKDSITQALNEKIAGKWYLPVPLSSLKSYDYVTLKRTKDDCCDEFFNFSTNHSFSSSTSKKFDLGDSQKYELRVSEDVTIKIELGFVFNKEGNKIFTNSGATFTLESIKNDTIKLKYYWR